MRYDQTIDVQSFLVQAKENKYKAILQFAKWQSEQKRCILYQYVWRPPSNQMLHFSLWAARELDSVYALRCWQLREPIIASNCKKIEFYVRIFFFFFLFLILEKDTSLRLWNLNCWDLFEFVKKPPFLDLSPLRDDLCVYEFCSFQIRLCFLFGSLDADAFLHFLFSKIPRNTQTT